MREATDETGQIFAFLLAAAARGERTALVTVAQVVGSSSRAVGTHVAVTQAGHWCGSISGGCIEAAVAGEAVRVLGTGMAEVIRFGQGSPLIDIRLPCGGGLDLLIVPDPDPAVIACVQAARAARQSALLSIGLDGVLSTGLAEATDRTGWRGDTLSVRHDPVLHLALYGQGDEVLALTRLGLAYGARVTVHTPDAGGVDTAVSLGAQASPLQTPDRVDASAMDCYTAAILLFHDHDWETGILAALLPHPALMIGAMGSPATHRQRLDRLRERGVGEADLARIIGPVGLIPSTRDPALLALSIMAQIGQLWSQRLPAWRGRRMTNSRSS